MSHSRRLTTLWDDLEEAERNLGLLGRYGEDEREHAEDEGGAHGEVVA
jgi:hypothetical protein